MVRQARERIPPAEYLAASYYETWISGLERLLVEHGLAKKPELSTGHSLQPSATVPRTLKAADVGPALAKGSRYDRPSPKPSAFKVGDRVRARVMNPLGHTRLPRYVRGHTGTIDRVHGVHVFPDSNAIGKGENQQWHYSDAFDAVDLWGEAATRGDVVLLDLWEPYLERV
jgi:nitrile hydratase